MKPDIASRCEVGVDGGALAEDDPTNDATLWLREQSAQRLRERFAKPVERASVAEVETRYGAEQSCHGGDPGDERGRAPTEPTRAVGARDRQDREDARQQHRQRDPGERRDLYREGDADRARRRGKEGRPQDRGHRVVTKSFMSAKTRAVTRPRVWSSSIRANG